MAKSMLFSVLLLLTTLTALSCQSPADTAQTDNSETRISENLAMTQETIEAGELAADSNIIYEEPDIDEKIPVDNKEGEADASIETSGQPETADENTGAGKETSVAETDSQADSSQHYFILQVGAYKNVEYANDILEKLKAIHLSAHIDKEDDFSKVRIAGIRTKGEVDFIVKEINNKFKLSPVLLKNVSK